MSASDERVAAEIAEAERMRDEAVSEFERFGLPRPAPLMLPEGEREAANEALREFQERLAAGEWYGTDEEDE